MQKIIEAAADAAFDRYEEASARAARYLTGAQPELFDTASAEAAEWHGIWQACERAVRS
ncbi:hypothetical protein [Luteimonas salinilitoris]|uniref:Uncharacterized protein n=1 Tax=Luteimonas salinilitoris TaxID=3237697 RepID=A0ABV4I010_9GAMM